MPGLAPAGDSIFFASPKKIEEKKGEPDSSPLHYGGSPNSQSPNSRVQIRPRRGLIDFGIGYWGLVFGIERRNEEASSAGTSGKRSADV
jgi:hypothetical protein